jgi:hypothetical protein
MIQPLRTAHRTTFTILAIALPILLTAAILSQKPTPKPAKITVASESVAEFRFLMNGDHVALSLNHLVGEARDWYVLRSELSEASLPETLLYCAPSEANVAVPAGASLVGPVAINRPFTMPEKCSLLGSLLLYDAPHATLLAQSPVRNH